MIRQIIVPTENTWLLHLPDEFVGKSVEVIAFSIDDVNTTNQPVNTKRTVTEAIAFYEKNAVDFSTLKKWTRTDLYKRT